MPRGASRSALLLLAAGLACGPEAPHSPDAPVVVARVDGQPVSETELRAAARLRKRGAEVDWSQALEDWISAAILRRELETRGLEKSDAYRTRLAAIRSRAWRAEQELARDTLLTSLEEGLELSEAELRARYEEQKDRFLTTRLHLRQITVPDRETLVAIRRRLADGEDFARLAAEANLDPALRANSGDLGWIEQRRMPTALIGPAHKLLREGDVSEVFEDREGRWNLVQLLARDPGVRRDFEQVRDQLARELRVVKSREALAALLASQRKSVSVERGRAALESLGSAD